MGYDSLGLLNGGMGAQSTGKTKSSGSNSRTSTTTTSSSGIMSSTNVKHPSRPSSKDPHISAQLLLPPDTQILEGISKLASGSLESGMKTGSKAERKEDKRKALESLRGRLKCIFVIVILNFFMIFLSFSDSLHFLHDLNYLVFRYVTYRLFAFGNKR